MKKILTLKTKDKLIEHEILTAHIFTVNYSKKIKKNEHHSPLTAILILKTESSLFNYLLINPIVQSDAKGSIRIYVPGRADVVERLVKPFDKQELDSNKNLHAFYNVKKNFGMSVSELIDQNKNKIISQLQALSKIKIPYEIGGE